MGGGTGNKAGYKGDDAEGMCGTTLEPDPRYSACCSNIFRPGRVLRDIIVGFLVVLAVAIVIAVLFVVCFYLLPGNKEGESSLGLEEGAFVGSPVKEKKHPNIINEVEFTDDTRYNVSSDPVLGKVKVGDHEDHHHTGPLPNPEPEPEPEPESESKATPDSKPEPDHVHEGVEMQHGHTHGEGDVGQEHAHKKGDAGQEHMHNAGDVGQEHMHNAGDVGHEHMHKEGDLGHEHMHKEGDVGHEHMHKEGDVGHEHMHKEGDVGHEHMHKEGDMGHEHMHKEGDVGHEHMHKEGDVDQEHAHTEGDVGHEHMHNAGDVSHEHVHNEGDVGHEHVHKEGDAGHEHMHKEGDVGHEHMHNAGDVGHEHMHKEGDVDHEHVHLEGDMGHGHVHKEGDHQHERGHSEQIFELAQVPGEEVDHEVILENKGSDAVFAPSAPHKIDDALVIIPAPSLDTTPASRAESESNATPVFQTTADELREGGGLPPLLDSLAPRHDASVSSSQALPEEQPTENPEENPTVETLKELSFPEGPTEYVESPTLPEAQPELHFPITTEEEAALTTDKPSEESAVTEEASHDTCRPRQLEMCSNLPYSLTAFPNWANDQNEVELHESSLPFFRDVIVRSRCSPRAQEYACAILEPPCSADGTILPPCRTFCRSVASTCQEFVISGVGLSDVFNCERFPDSTDPAVCFDMTNEPCVGREHRCGDGRCVAKRLVCDGRSDCLDHSDEAACPGQLPGCNYGDFRCATTDFCIPVSWMCDGADDCHDNSDETNCDTQHPSVTQVSSTGEHLEALAPLGQFPLPGGDFGKTIESRNEFIVNQYDYAELVSENSPHSRDKARELNFDDTIQQEFVPSQAALVGEPTTVESDPNPLSSGEQLQLQSEESELLQQFSGEVPILNEAPPYGQAPNGQRGLPPNQKYSNEKEEFGEQPVNHVSQTEQLSNDHDGLPSSRQSIFSLENPLSNENTDQYSSEENFQYSSLEPTQTGYQTSRPFQTDQLFSNEASITESQELNFDEQSINSRLQAFQEQKSLEETLQTNLGHKLLQNNQKLSSKEKLSNNDSQLRGVQHSSILEHHGDDYQQFPGGQAPQNTVKGAQSKTNEGYLDSKFLVTERERQVTKKESLEESNTKLKDIDLAIPITNFPEENRKSDTPGRMRGSIRFSRTNRPSTQRPSESPYVNSPTSPPPDSESSSSGSFRSRFQQWRSSRFPPSPSYESRQTESFRERQHNSPTVSDKKAVEEEKVTEEGADNIRSSSRLRIPNHRSVGPTRITRVRPTLRTSRISSSSHFFPQEEFLKEGINFDATAEVASTEFDNEPASSALSPVIVQGPHFTLPAQPYSPHSSGSAYRNIQNDGSKTFMPKEESLGDEQQAYDPSSVTYDFERRTGSSSLYYGQESSGFNMPINHSPAYLPYTPNHYLHGNIQK